MTIEVIIFDLDDTLIADEASADASIRCACELAHDKYSINPDELHQTVRKIARELWYASPARDYCVSVGTSSWEGLCVRLRENKPELETLRNWLPKYRQQVWLQSLVKHGIDDPSLAERLANMFQQKRRSHYIIYPDTKPVLKQLGETYRLALLTNGLVDLQREKIEASGLNDYFKVITISGEIGIGKPDPAIFELVLKRLGIEADNAIMVGNSLKSDVAGAQGVGIMAVWVNRTGAKGDDTITPDAEIKSLSELGRAIEHLE